MIGTTGTCIPYGGIPPPIIIGSPPYPPNTGEYIGKLPIGMPGDSAPPIMRPLLAELMELAGDPGICRVGDGCSDPSRDPCGGLGDPGWAFAGTPWGTPARTMLPPISC